MLVLQTFSQKILTAKFIYQSTWHASGNAVIFWVELAHKPFLTRFVNHEEKVRKNRAQWSEGTVVCQGLVVWQLSLTHKGPQRKDKSVTRGTPLMTEACPICGLSVVRDLLLGPFYWDFLILMVSALCPRLPTSLPACGPRLGSDTRLVINSSTCECPGPAEADWLSTLQLVL